MSLDQLISRLALAFGIGLLIGLERGWHSRDVRSGGRTAGVRTFAISGLLGGIVAALSGAPAQALTVGGAILMGSCIVAFTSVVLTFEREEHHAANSFSATTTIAALLTFMLGAYALLGDVRVAAAAAIVTAGILFVREGIHQWVARITVQEFESALILLAMSFIALPVLPDRPIAALANVDLREVWIIAIVLAAVSFIGYLAVKRLGERRGVLVASAAGGLVSSTAVTLANARRAAAGEGSPQLLAAGAIVATAISLVRVTGLVVFLEPGLTPFVAPALLTGALTAAALSTVVVRGLQPTATMEPVLRFSNPFVFWSVAGMALLMGALIVMGRIINAHLGIGGTIAGAALMGLFDVDAMTVSVTGLPSQSIRMETAAAAILVGVAANTSTKIVIGAVLARGRFAAISAGVYVVSAAAAAFVALML